MAEENNTFIEAINNIEIKREKEDYMKDDILFCGKCNTPKSTKLDLPPKLSKIFKNKIKPIKCKCREEKIKKDEKQEEINKAYNRIDILLAKGIMDNSYLKYDIRQDDKKNEEITYFCNRYIKNWNEMKNNGVGLLFFGNVGTGKTFHACCIANELLKRGEKICVTNFMRILNKYKNFEEDLNDTINMICNSTLLVLDDFGAERKTEFANEKIFEVIDFRCRKKLPTLITTNLTIKELQNGDLTSKRIFSRISKMCPLKLSLMGEDRRIKQENKDAKKVLKLLNKD